VNEAQNGVAPIPPSLTMARRQLSRLQTSPFGFLKRLVETAAEVTGALKVEVVVGASEPTLPIATHEQAELI
jgi:hypothetical protein